MAEENKKIEETIEEVKVEEAPKEETPEVVLSEVDFKKFQLKNDIPEIKAGDMVKVYQKIKDKDNDKERVQAFEGQVLFSKHGKEIGATITVRKVVSGIGVEKTFPIHSPLIEKIEIVK